MKLLLDTHYVLWVTVFADRLTIAEQRLIESNEAAASAMSLWELRIKWRTLGSDGRRKGPADPADVLAGLGRLGIETLPLTADQACAVLEHPTPHKDPFDEQLLIHAQELGAKLLTRDSRLLAHPLAYRLP
ncbi:MAG: type II toxin-antitoxin system VapC family toxin [Pseudomonadota bacterium]